MKILDRPTIAVFNAKLKSFDERINGCVSSNNKNKIILSSMQSDLNSELDTMQTNISGTKKVISRKIDRVEVNKIWDHF